MQILIIQTAFIGDVVLSTAVAEKLHLHFPEAAIDYCVRQGHESLFDHHPFVRRVYLLDKSRKLTCMVNLIRQFRGVKYDLVVNLHRFLSSGLLTCSAGAHQTVGFRKNPLSLCFSERRSHVFDGRHEVDRNLRLIESFTDGARVLPRLYVSHLKATIEQQFGSGYVVIAPGSVWATKKVPLDKWVELIKKQLSGQKVYLVGSKVDGQDAEYIKRRAGSEEVVNVAGKMTLLEAVALMKGATMNYVNDSAPLHFASAVNAPVTAVFCSTIPSFGFTPLSDQSVVIETSENLPCRPCGLHGKAKCPKGHFKCGNALEVPGYRNRQ